MTTKTAKQDGPLRAKSAELAAQLGAIDGLLKGSLIERFTVCGNARCRCARGDKHGPFLYLSVSDGKRSRHIYVPKAMTEQVRAWVQNYQQAKAIIETMSSLSIDRITIRRRK